MCLNNQQSCKTSGEAFSLKTQVFIVIPSQVCVCDVSQCHSVWLKEQDSLRRGATHRSRLNRKRRKPSTGFPSRDPQKTVLAHSVTLSCSHVHSASALLWCKQEDSVFRGGKDFLALGKEESWRPPFIRVVWETGCLAPGDLALESFAVPVALEAKVSATSPERREASLPSEPAGHRVTFRHSCYGTTCIFWRINFLLFSIIPSAPFFLFFPSGMII